MKLLVKEVPDGSLMIEIFQIYLFKNLIRAIDDKVEKHREMVIHFFEIYLSFSNLK
jgi:hypothetical protein